MPILSDEAQCILVPVSWGPLRSSQAQPSTGTYLMDQDLEEWRIHPAIHFSRQVLMGRSRRLDRTLPFRECAENDLAL